MNLRKLNESIDWLDKAAKWQPGIPDIYRVLGLDYAFGGMLRESEEAFRQGMEIAPELGAALFGRPRALRTREIVGFRKSVPACN
jgi:tetratricopeptide (TPR) repeat protein